MHYELQGIQHPSVVTVEVTNAGDLRKLRDIHARVEDLKKGDYEAHQIFSAEIEEAKKFREQLASGAPPKKVSPKAGAQAASKT